MLIIILLYGRCMQHPYPPTPLLPYSIKFRKVFEQWYKLCFSDFKPKFNSDFNLLFYLISYQLFLTFFKLISITTPMLYKM